MSSSVIKNTESDKCMDLSIKLFRAVGCWPKWSHKRKRSERIYYIYTGLMCAVLFIYVFILAYGLSVHYKTWKSLEEAIEDIIVFATGLIVVFKMILILWNQAKFEVIIDYINYDLNARHAVEEEDQAVIRSCIRHERFLAKTYVFFGYCITTLYTTSSVIRILRQRSSGATQEYTLPLKYPFHPQEFPLYHLAYFHQMLVMILNGHIGTLADSFFSCLTYYVCGHFTIIKNRILRDNGLVTKNFISYHNEIIRLVGKVQSIFGPFLMFQLTSTSLLICLGLFQITQTKNIKLLHYLKCLIYVGIKLIQLFLYCWYGQEIIERSSSISFGAYSGKWHEAQGKIGRSNLGLVLLRSQKAVKITAGNFFLVSLPTLATVINTAYSFFTMLKTVQKDDLE